MLRRPLIVFLGILFLGGILGTAWWLYRGYFQFNRQPLPMGYFRSLGPTGGTTDSADPTSSNSVSDAADDSITTATDSQTDGENATLNPSSAMPGAVDFRLEVLAENLYVPWDVVFPRPGEIWLTERNGQIRQIVDGRLQETPLIRFPEAASTGEAGLMGLTLHPNFASNSWAYACLAYEKDNRIVDKVVRMMEVGDGLEVDRTIIDDIPAAQFHAGCRIAFGPDEKLYVSTGDATDGQLAQRQDSLAGKILRLNDDGSIPDDNPFQDSAIFSLGHRNPQGLSWHPVSGLLYSAEHGPSGFDGPGGGDEVNLIEAGGNYGWPEVHHEQSAPGFIDPLLTFTPAEAPGSAHMYSGKLFPQFKHKLLIGALRGEGLLVLGINESDPKGITSIEKLPIDAGRVRTITEDSKGHIYFTTSNRDGRGEVRPMDDKLYRLVPVPN